MFLANIFGKNLLPTLFFRETQFTEDGYTQASGNARIFT
jgi:hypothetical protein